MIIVSKKYVFTIVFVLFLSLLLIGGSITQDTETGSGDLDTTFYVEDNGNLFIKLAKILDQLCLFIVDIVVSGISNVFNLILGG